MPATCQYPGNQPGTYCGAVAVFSVLRRDFSPVHPAQRDNWDCCEEHLGRVVLDIDQWPEPGYVVSVSVIATTQNRQAG